MRIVDDVFEMEIPTHTLYVHIFYICVCTRCI